ncbi:MAG: hypothetical protein AAGH76_10910 [Pseudomonadota bacterium]
MEATASARNSAGLATQETRPSAGPATNETPYRFDGPVNAAVPSHQARVLWLALIGTALPIVVYALLVIGTGVWMVYSGLVAPLFGDGYSIGKLLLGGFGVALLGLAVRPFVLRRYDAYFIGATPATDEDDLVRFVNDIADHLGVDRPTSVLLTVEPVVHALHQYEATVPKLNSARLFVGLPVVQSLTIRELGGVIAHELTHFAVAENRSLRMAITTIATTIHQASRDDDAIDRLIKNDTSVGPQVRRLTAQLVNVGRWPVLVLAKLIERVAGSTLAEAEFHADWFHAELTGSATFKTTAERMHLLRYVFDDWKESVSIDPAPRFAADLGRVVHDSADRQAAHSDKLLRDRMLEDCTFVGGPHLPNMSRIERVRAVCFGPGVLHGDQSAYSLLLHPARTARAATLSYLRDGLRLSVADSDLLSDAAVSQQLEEEREFGDVLDRYLLGFCRRDRFLAPGDPGAVLKTAVDKRVEQIESLCADIRRGSPEARACLTAYGDAMASVIDEYVSYSIDEFNSPDDADKTSLSNARRQLKATETELVDIEKRYADRLALGIATALGDAVRANPQAAAEEQRRFARLVGVQNAFAKYQPDVRTLREALALARTVTTAPDQKERVISDVIGALNDAVDGVRHGLSRLPDPLAEHNRPFLASVDEKCQPSGGNSSLAAAAEFLRCLEDAYLRVMVRLAEIALGAEQRHNIRLKLID